MRKSFLRCLQKTKKTVCKNTFLCKTISRHSLFLKMIVNNPVMRLATIKYIKMILGIVRILRTKDNNGIHTLLSYSIIQKAMYKVIEIASPFFLHPVCDSLKLRTFST